MSIEASWGYSGISPAVLLSMRSTAHIKHLEAFYKKLLLLMALYLKLSCRLPKVRCACGRGGCGWRIVACPRQMRLCLGDSQGWLGHK